MVRSAGTNACYVERKCAGTKVQSQSGQMIINIEWGNFAAPSLPMLDADRKIDHGSVNPGAGVARSAQTQRATCPAQQ